MVAYTEDGNIRTFNPNVDPILLQWHRDDADRDVTVLDGDNWYYQENNKLPILLERGKTIHIPHGVWHRVIKGDNPTPLKLKINENY